ncbi:MAG: SNF2-related protein [Chloroflexota bacterium]|nr:SNF2-related protein [Dehalococcoidia bacterium]MDW8253854.1 SNF2-related protein [Chloroflexota bacterium]
MTYENEVIAVTPSSDALEEAARQLAKAYPGLYRHQQSGIAFLLSRRRAILADDMGLGKTRQAIIALREAAPEGPFLIICPAGVKLTWRREIEAIEPDAAITVIDGANLQADARWTIVNYDRLGQVEKALLATPWAGIVVDEAHYIKNDSQRTTRVLRLLGVGSGPKPVRDPEAVYLLTGTPMANRPRDLFNLLKAVRHPLSKNFYVYARRYCAAHDNGYGLDTRGASNLEELAALVSGIMLRRTKDEALDLPPKTRIWQEIEIKSQKARQLEARAIEFFEKHPATQGPTWSQFLGLLNTARHALAEAKIPHTLEAVHERLEAEEKVVVFTNYAVVVQKLKEELGAAAVTITGDTPAAARQEAADALQQDPSIRVLVGNLVAAGVGLTMTAATHVIFNDLDWVPANHWQAEDRIYRIGQTRPAFITYLVATETLDDFVAAVLEQKARTIGVLEEYAAHNASVVEEIVQAAVRGERPERLTPRYQPPTDRGTVGVLGDVLDLLAKARRGLAAAGPAEQTFTFPSESRPGLVHTVTVAHGVARCTCEGFAIRGNCKHVRAVANRLAA